MSRIHSAIRSAIAAANNLGVEIFKWADRLAKLLDICGWAYSAAEYVRENELLTVVQSFFA
jgi:hypothetical protein